ncbi:hypothetical protein ElyMa_003418500 [Elysia marginata]|uniref:Uncharacterized protein n=1 Tax=Elysia marginata TaxID=1093978 RepID=A0AAV4JST0_9GAST|nr:hypothetical protein ElyMa_003418500 [Elysia marginata]
MEMLYLGGENVPYSYRPASSGHGYRQFQCSSYGKYDWTSSCVYAGAPNVASTGAASGSLHSQAAGYVPSPASDTGHAAAGTGYPHHHQVLPTAFGGYHPFQQMTSSCMGFFQRRPGRIKATLANFAGTLDIYGHPSSCFDLTIQYCTDKSGEFMVKLGASSCLMPLTPYSPLLRNCFLTRIF